MPDWLTNLLSVLGLSTPGIYAFGTYSLFRWLDNRASPEAKSAILNLLDPKQYDNAAVAAAILEAFNRVYTPRLLSWSAFRRSALYSICLTTIFLYENGSLGIFSQFSSAPVLYWLFGIGLAFQFCTNIVSDYVSLFPVRKLLALKTVTPLIALWVGPLVGIAIVTVCNLIDNAIYALYYSDFNLNSFVYLSTFEGSVRSTLESPIWRPMLVAGMVVHLWLPLFSISVGLLRLLRYFRKAVGWTQWFFKDGSQHPFEAIGWIAAVIVFVSTTIAFKL